MRRGDPDRFRTALFAPPEKREGLFALYAFNLEIAKIAPMVSEPMIGEIRLQWWRDTLEMIYVENRIRHHEVAQPLAAVIRAAALPREPFDALIDARARDLDPGFPQDIPTLNSYLRDTAGSLTLLAARSLCDADVDTVAMEAGAAIGTARYLAAVPILAVQGGKPLPGDIDWRVLRKGEADPALGNIGLIESGLAAAATARQARDTIPRIAAPALLELPRAVTALRAMHEAETLDDLAPPHASPFRTNLSNFWRGATGRWW